MNLDGKYSWNANEVPSFINSLDSMEFLIVKTVLSIKIPRMLQFPPNFLYFSKLGGIFG